MSPPFGDRYAEFQLANQIEVCELEKSQARRDQEASRRVLEKNYAAGRPPLLLRNSGCPQKPEPRTNLPEWNVGYDCLDGSQYHQPDRVNTFHNYLVLQQEGSRCTENHQVFNNWTKRKNFSTEAVEQKAPPLPEPMPQEPWCDVSALLRARSSR